MYVLASTYLVHFWFKYNQSSFDSVPVPADISVPADHNISAIDIRKVQTTYYNKGHSGSNFHHHD